MTNKSLKISHTLLAAVALFPWITASAQTTANPIVDFVLDASVSSGNTYQNFHQAGAGSSGVYVIGFNVDVSHVNGAPNGLGPVAGFCIELSQNIGNGTWTYEAGHLYQASAGIAGTIGTSSSNIPVGGIGDLRAARVRYLFDHFYQSSNISLWTHNSTTSNIHAFQLALWEVSHDDDLSLSNTNGSIYFSGGQGSGANAPFRNNVINLANSWLTNISNAGVTESYTSTTIDVATLISVQGTNNGPDYQDLVMGYAKGAPGYDQFTQLIPVPEPSSILSILFGSLLTLRRRR